MWSTPAEMHAALNDLAPALFITAVVFDLAGHWSKRETLQVAGYWTLMAGVAGAFLGVLTGLRAEATIEHGPVVHRTIERHETLAIAATVFFVGLAAWRVWRKGSPPGREKAAYLTASIVGALGIIWAAKVGGNILFDHAGGIETRILRSATVEREAGHAHQATTSDDHEHPESDSAPAAESHEHD